MNVRFPILLAALVGSAALAAACSDDPTDATPTPTPVADAGADRTAVPPVDPADSGPTDSATTPDGQTSSCGLVVPTTYESANFATNTAAEAEMRTRLGALNTAMRNAEADLTITPTAAELKALFDAGTPSLRTLTTPYYAEKVDGFLEAFEAAAGKEWTPVDPPAGDGGRYGSWIFTPTGIDLRQQVEKGLFAAMFYRHILTLLDGPITEVTIDRLVAAYGTTPAFPKNDLGPTADGGVAAPDALTALYAKRREPRDATAGLYTNIKRALITAKAAVARGAECNADRDAALATFKLEYERALAATCINYLQGAATKMGAASPTQADLASALHAHGEAVAFMHGFRTLPANGRKITDAQIDDYLSTLNAPANAPATAHRFVTDTGLELAKLTQAINKLAQIYGFSSQEVAGFRNTY
jgi:hypothetical protein